MKSRLHLWGLALLSAIALSLVGSPVYAQGVSFAGPVPPLGGYGLLVTVSRVPVGSILTDLAAGRCAAETVGVLTSGKWQIYAVGAPAVVNALFPPELEPSTPFFVRCSTSSVGTGAQPGPAPAGDPRLLRDRAAIRTWARTRSINDVNSAVSGLSPSERDALAALSAQIDGPPVLRDRVLGAIREVLHHPDLGFYLEVFAYTDIELAGDGFRGTCNKVWLTPTHVASMPASELRNTLMHEVFHSFNCVNGGPSGALDEGAAIWVFKAAFPSSSAAGDWAEATYGTASWYRQIQKVTDYPLGISRAPTLKLLDVYAWLSARDPSRLPWNSEERLRSCYERYWARVDRDVDFARVWLPAAAGASRAMLLDPACGPV